MINGLTRYDFVTGGIVAVVSILMVFLILVLIIFLTELIAKSLNTNDINKEITKEETVIHKTVEHLDLNDEDATVACLIASIDYRNKTKKNIRVVSVREVK